MSDLPNGWTTVNLEKCVDILDNLRVPINSDERNKRIGKVPYYGATGQVGWINDFLFNEKLLLIGEDGAPFFDKSKNISYIISGKSWINNHVHVLRALNEITSNSYLKYFLNQFDYTNFVNGTTRLKLTQGSIRKIPVPLAPIGEQKRIVAKLDKLLSKVDTSKARLDAIPQTLKRFRQSVLSAAVTGELTKEWRKGNSIHNDWISVPFGNIIKVDPQNGLYKSQEYYGKGTHILRIDNFYDGTINNWSELKRLELSNSEKNNYLLSNNDIIINRVNSMPFLGKSALVRNLEEPCVFESNMMRIQLNTENAYPEYVIKYLNSIPGLSELRKNAKHAVNQSSINQKDVKAVIISLPSIEEQKEIVRRVEQLFKFADKIEARYNKAKQYADRLTQSILAKAFRGELVMQDPDDEPAEKLLERIKSAKKQPLKS